MQFGLDLRAFAAKTTAKANMVVSKIIIDVGTALVMKSPVGDPTYWQSPAPPGYVGGRFRANWQYGIGAIDKTTTNTVDPNGQATIAAIVGKVSPDKAANVHYITNTLPYAIPIEDGHSYRQAPQGVARLTAMEFQPIVEAAARAVQ